MRKPPFQPWSGVELEVFVCGGSFERLLDWIPKKFQTVPYSGKGGGWFLDAGDGVLIKLNSDGPISGEHNVCELTTWECCPATAAYQAGVVFDQFLGRMEKEAARDNIRVFFRRCSEDLFKHRAAFQVSSSKNRSDISDLERSESLAPLLVSLPSLVGPGGPTPLGFVRDPRASLFVRNYRHESCSFAPLDYPRSDATVRWHVSPVYPRSPAAVWLTVSVISLAHFAYELEPSRFRMRLVNKLRALRKLSASVDNCARVEVLDDDCHAVRKLTGLEIQGELLQTVRAVLEGYEPEPWMDACLSTWQNTIQDVTEGRPTAFSDWTLKFPVWKSLLADAGLEIESVRCREVIKSCFSLLHSGLDEELLSATQPSELWPALRELIQFEIAWSRVGESCLVDRVIGDHWRMTLPQHEEQLAPRARLRRELLRRFVHDPILKAAWRSVQTSSGVFNLGNAPNSESWIKH